MKSNGKDFKKIISLLAVSILIIVLFFFLHKTLNNKINTNKNIKNENTIKTEESDKNNGKNSDGNSTTVKDESGENQTTTSNKDNKDNKGSKEQEKGQTTNDTKNEKGLTVFVKAANFGSTVELLIDKSNFNSNYKNYQFFLGNKPISNIESITKSETTIFPAQEGGSEVVLKLLDENNKVLKELKIKLNEKK